MRILALLLLLAPSAQAQFVSYTQAAQHHGGGGGGTLVVKHNGAVDPGSVGLSTGILDPWAANVDAAGDLIAIGISYTNSTTGVLSICDSTTNTTCTVSANTYTIGTPVGGGVCGGVGICTVWAWTCNTVASVRYFTVTFTGGTGGDKSVAVFDVKHNVTGSCHDASASASNATVGATLTSSTYTTAVANEIALATMSDDNNCGPNFTGTAGTGFTLGNLATACSSMLGAPEYTIYTSTQTSVTASINTGNSAGNPVTMAVETFE